MKFHDTVDVIERRQRMIQQQLRETRALRFMLASPEHAQRVMSTFGDIEHKKLASEWGVRGGKYFLTVWLPNHKSRLHFDVGTVPANVKLPHARAIVEQLRAEGKVNKEARAEVAAAFRLDENLFVHSHTGSII